VSGPRIIEENRRRNRQSCVQAYSLKTNDDGWIEGTVDTPDGIVRVWQGTGWSEPENHEAVSAFSMIRNGWELWVRRTTSKKYTRAGLIRIAARLSREWSHE